MHPSLCWQVITETGEPLWPLEDTVNVVQGQNDILFCFVSLPPYFPGFPFKQKMEKMSFFQYLVILTPYFSAIFFSLLG